MVSACLRYVLVHLAVVRGCMSQKSSFLHFLGVGHRVHEVRHKLKAEAQSTFGLYNVEQAGA